MAYPKKDGRIHVRPSFFWYDNDKDHEACFLVMRVMYMYMVQTVHADHFIIYYNPGFLMYSP